jgi:hypothetical protein
VKLDCFTLALPAQCTDVAQTVDDNVGKQFKADLREKFAAFLESFDWDKNPKGKISAGNKRKLMAQYIDDVAREYNAKHKSLIESSSIRTGMFLTVDGRRDQKMVPVKYEVLDLRINFFELKMGQ